MIYLVLFTFMEVWALSQGYQYVQVNGTDTLYAIPNETAIIRCNSEYALSYCGIEDPKGNKYTFTDLTETDGQCEMPFTMTSNHTGLWKCFLGANFTQLEKAQQVLVKIAKPLSAVESNVTVTIGLPTVLTCISLQSPASLCHCMFTTPQGESFYINENATKESPVLGRYYFPSSHSLGEGYCSIYITSVEQKDLGFWKCEAGCPGKEDNADIIFIDIGELLTPTSKKFAITALVMFIAATCLAFIVIAIQACNIFYSYYTQDELGTIERGETPGRRPRRNLNSTETIL